MTHATTCILGGGVTGLAAGYASGGTVFEAAPVPGGICSSYYVRPGETERTYEAPEDGEAYRFEVGGGHWIFGGDPAVLRFLAGLVPLRFYERKSSVYFAEEERYVPYPLQNHLSYLGPQRAAAILEEMLAPPQRRPATMAEWLEANFGRTLSDAFFDPFHERYTAGLWREIAPQDPYKSPVRREQVVRGALGATEAAGYNLTFCYPVAGLDALTRRLAARSTVRYGRRAVRIDADRKVVHFADGSDVSYEVLISTVPLHLTMEMAGVQMSEAPDPHTSVLVLNIGARRGERCPDAHWVYVPDSRSGFFRVGFYSNVDLDFLPLGLRAAGDRVSLYVERAYRGGEVPTEQERAYYARSVVAELQAWRFIEDVEVLDPTWIDVAYTWSRPGSTWSTQAGAALERKDIVMAGRYGRWKFQGIAESIQEGFVIGSTVRESDVRE